MKSFLKVPLILIIFLNLFSCMLTPRTEPKEKVHVNIYNGAWPHWINYNGNATGYDSISGGDIVETAYLTEGLLTSIQYFNQNTLVENYIRKMATSLWKNINWDAYRNNTDYIYWHCQKNNNFEVPLQQPITGFNEAMIVYLLAMASPTHSVPYSCYLNGWVSNNYTTSSVYYGYSQYIHNLDTPLFWTHYSFLGFDPRVINDGNILTAGSYYDIFKNICLINYNHCINNSFYGYNASLWGLTASDGPFGYGAWSSGNDNGTVSPTAAISSMPYTPSQSYAVLTNLMFNPVISNKVLGQYGFINSFNLAQNWYDSGIYLAIDQGPIMIMIENYRSQLLWKLFMSHPDIQALLSYLQSNGWTITPQTYNGTPLDSTPMDSAILDTIQKISLKYFLMGNIEFKGLPYDRSSDGNLISIGGTGMSMMAIIIGIERNFITRETGASQISNMLNFLNESDH